MRIALQGLKIILHGFTTMFVEFVKFKIISKNIVYLIR